MAAKKAAPKMSYKQDMMQDKKRGIPENSKRDKALDKARGFKGKY